MVRYSLRHAPDPRPALVVQTCERADEGARTGDGSGETSLAAGDALDRSKCNDVALVLRSVRCALGAQQIA
jgi:hypothetical protein